jgi:hypothetical protein
MIENIEQKTNNELVAIIGGTVIGTPSGLNAQQAQAELNKRLINSMDNLNKSTTDYSRRLLDLNVVLFLVAIAQLIVSIKAASKTTSGWVWGTVLALYSIYFIISRIVKDRTKKS